MKGYQCDSTTRQMLTDRPADTVTFLLEGTHLAQPPLQGYGVPSLKGHLHTLLKSFCVRDTQDNSFQLE